jgi:hypothetical protein
LENQFTPHDLCDESHKQRIEAGVQALLETVNNNSPERIRTHDLKKLVNSLKMRKACGSDGIQSNASGTFQEDLWYT